MTMRRHTPEPSCPTQLTLGPVNILHRGDADTRLINTGSAEPCYHLVFPLRSPLRFCQAGMTGEVPPGTYVLLRGDRFYDLTAFEDLSQRVVVLPASALAARLVDVDRHVGGRFGADPQMAALVSKTISTTAQVFCTAPPRQPEALGAEMVALIALMLGAEEVSGPPSRSGRSRTRQRIVDHIERHLPDPELAPAGIARAVGISRSHLYALFADGGESVSEFVRNRRLQAAYELLVSDGHGCLAISEVAYRTGFRSPAHFSRSFSRQFNAAPRDVRASGAIR